ncbi:MAG: four helix bundle protein [bacterium]
MNSEQSEGCVDRKVDGAQSIGKVRGYQDLRVYQDSYQAMLLIYKDLLKQIPRSEYDLIDQLRRSCKAVPRLIAEGHSKRYQRRGFQKYIDDALAEANETTVSLSQVQDLCECVDKQLCEQLITTYDKICRQLYNLSLSWQKFAQNKISKTIDPSTVHYSIDPTHRPTTNQRNLSSC